MVEHEYRLSDETLLNLFDQDDEAPMNDDEDALDKMLEEELGSAPRRRKRKN